MFTTKKTLLKRIAAGMLAAIMVMALLPGTSVTQVNADTTDALDNLVLRKWAQLEDDGTYTIQLEAYAKGEVKTTVKKETVPADIVLVLDQSGSMTTNKMSGIPSDTYTKVNSTPTNQQAKEGSYYYKVGNTYYPLEVEKKIVKTETKWIGQDGKEYTEDQLSYAWTSSNGEVYTTEKPFVTTSLKTFTRKSEKNIVVNQFWYVNDKDANDKSDKKYWRTGTTAQEAFKSKYETDSTTVEFGTKGATSDDPLDTANDPYYVAAVYTTVTKQENITYEYIYSYTDDNGTEHILNENNKSSDDTAACPVSPLYTRGTKTGTRLEALQYAANDFIRKVQKNAVKNNLDHRIAVVGFASDDYEGYKQYDQNDTNQYYYSNTELFIGDTQYNYATKGQSSTYNTTGNLAKDKYGQAFQSVKDATGYANLKASIGALAGKGATWPHLGFEMANGIFEKNSAAYTKADGTTGTRSRIIVFLTDGEPGDSGYNEDAADKAVTNADDSKTKYKATVHTIAVLDKKPTTDGNVDKFLKNTSSSGSYTLALSAADLTDFFDSVNSNIESPESAVTLSADAVLKDYVSEYFEIPDGFTVEDNVTIQTANALVGENAFGTPQAAPSGVTAELITGTDGKTIEGVQVSGFDYLSLENMVTVTGTDDNAKASGKKLIVTLKGLLAKDSAATGNLIDTNTTDSAIWDKDADGQEAKVKEFPVPHTRLAKKAFVLDYAKEAALDVYHAAKVDDDEDLLFSYVGEDSTVLKQKYGTAAVKDGTGLTYTPSTMQWDGYDTFYALGKDTVLGDARTQNIWSKVSVIPANNVYYEDDFVTDNASGTVGIVYAGDWKVTTTNDPDDWKDALEAGSGAGANTEIPNTENHGGWQNADLADDTTFTDGSAHVSSTKGATATFTFTGKGVDVYSYTDLNSGVVRARLYKGTETKDALMTKSYIIDNYADSGEYYQIPTVGFLLEEYGTYTVELMVFPKGNTAGARSTYYLDGVRIYNPLNEEDETVTDAYGDEADAVFRSIREILLDAESLEVGTTDGVVFIDQIKDADGTTTGEHTTSVIGTYEDLGPKNEVYLASGQAIAFAVNPAGTYSVGLKAMTGQTAKASVSSVTETGEDARKEYEVKHSSDLYYEVVPNEDGLILIRNTGDNLLSITKLKMCGEASVETPDTVMLLAYADTFDTLEVADTEKEPADENVPGTDSKDDPAEQEKPVQTISQFIKQIFESLRGWFRH